MRLYVLGVSLCATAASLEVLGCFVSPTSLWRDVHRLQAEAPWDSAAKLPGVVLLDETWLPLEGRRQPVATTYDLLRLAKLLGRARDHRRAVRVSHRGLCAPTRSTRGPRRRLQDSLDCLNPTSALLASLPMASKTYSSAACYTTVNLRLVAFAATTVWGGDATVLSHILILFLLTCLASVSREDLRKESMDTALLGS